MFRKMILAAAALSALGASAMAPTAASAHGWKPHVHVGVGHFGIHVPYYRTYNSCLRKSWVHTHWGYKVRWINVCGY